MFTNQGEELMHGPGTVRRELHDLWRDTLYALIGLIHKSER